MISMNNLNNILDIARSHWKPFIVSAIAIFAVVSIQYLITQPIRPMISPRFKVEQFDRIRPKLEKKANTFQLKKPTNFVPAAYAAEGYNGASAYGVMDADTGELLLEKNLSEKVAIASLTKIMTAIVTLDLMDPGEQYVVSEKAAGIPPTKMGLIVGQSWGRDELLNALMLTSANDVAELLKEGADKKYGPGTFMQAMNEKAKFLKLKSTHFDNPQGFDGRRHYSSVEDLLVLTNYGLNNYPILKEMVAKDYQFYQATTTHKQADLYNWNGLLGVYPGISGIKIGNTERGGYCTIVISERDGKRLMAAVLGSPGVLQRDLWAAGLLDNGFNKLAGLKPVNVTEDQLKQKYASWKYFE